MNKISKSELVLMEFIWQESKPLCIQDFIQHFTNSKTWKRTTIQTFIKRLIDKGFLIVNNEGHNYYYEPAITKSEYTQIGINEIMNKSCGYSLEGVIATFCGLDIDPENIDRIRNFLTDLEKSNEQK